MKDTSYYSNLYQKFILSRSKRILKDCSVELHHIIPKCMGGSNESNNLIALSSREHFLAHLLLYKSNPSNISLKKALHAMFKGDKSQQLKRNFNSRFYAIMRESVFVKMPSKQELCDLYHRHNLSFNKIGRKYNVSDMTVCKWFKISNISVKKSTDYKFKMPSCEELEKSIRDDKYPYIKTRSDFGNISLSLLYKWLEKYKLNRPAVYPRPKRRYSC